MTESGAGPNPRRPLDANGRDIGRVEALKVVALAALAGVTIPTISLEAYYLARETGLIDWADNHRHDLDIFLPSEEFCPATETITTYSRLALQSTYAIAAGDSIGKGYWKRGQPATPAIKFATDEMNQNEEYRRRFDLRPEHRWETLVVAQEGSRVVDLQRQLTDPRVSNAFRDRPNIDFWVSIGGNDIVNSLAHRAAEIRHLDQDQLPWDNPQFFTIDHEMVQAIAEYKDNFRNVLASIAGMSHGNLNRLVIEGLPNLGTTEKIIYVSRDGQTTAEFPLKDKPIAQYLARNLSVLVNNAMKQVINEMLLEHNDFDIVFLDNFHDLDQKNLLGEHPTPDGQKEIAAEFFYRANSESPHGNLGMVLYPNANPALVSIRRLLTLGPNTARYGYHEESENNTITVPLDFDFIAA